jgi:uncharacterized protein YeaO (DUF488 family)
MAIRVVRLGTPRASGEGVRLGTVRRPPRGVSRDAIAAKDFYDVWLPELAPSPELLAWATAEPLAGRRWDQFARRYRREMQAPAARHLIALLAALSQEASFAVGCYCADEARCHRSLLRQLLLDSGARIAGV